MKKNNLFWEFLIKIFFLKNGKNKQLVDKEGFWEGKK